MKLKYRFRIFTAVLFWVCAVVVRAQSPAAEFASSPGVRSDRCAVMILDLATGEVVDSHNENAPLVPASVTKAVTIATTLEQSGVKYRYHTKVYAVGRIESGMLEGNLLVEGGGDPTLGADVEPKGSDIMPEIVSVLRKHGVDSIAGSIVTDCGIYTSPATPKSWAPGDLKHYYGTGCHGLNYRRNATGRQAVKDPPAMFVKTLISILEASGIKVCGGDYPMDGKRVILLDHQSPPIDDIMRSCMKRSDNLYAEALLRTLALLCGKPGDTGEGAAIEMDFWKKKGADMESVLLIDGSGLSRFNRMTAKFITDVLVKMSYNADYVSFFPLAGQEGTMRSFLKDTPLDGYIAMKTGSMGGVQCFAGYMLDEDYAPTHVVVILINDFPGTRSAVRDKAAKMLLDTFAGDNGQ